MKAVIVEIRGKEVAALTSGGQVLIFKNNNYIIGQTVETKKMKSTMRKAVKWAASAAAVIVMCTASAWAYYTPYYYMSIDVNPSVEYSINRFDRVLSVAASNNDGEEILKEINIDSMKNKRIEEAVNILFDEVIKEGYFDGEEGGVVVAASSSSTEKSEKLTSRIKTSVEEKVKESAANPAVDVVAVNVGAESVKAAKEIGVTPGKLNLIQDLQKSAGKKGNIHMEEWLDKPVKDIIKATNEYKKEDKTYKASAIIDKDENSINSKDEDNSKNKNNSGRNDVKENSKGKDGKSDKSSEVRLKDLECTVTSIDINLNSASVLLSNGKNMNIYFNKESNDKDTKNRNVKIENLKENDKINVDLNYKNDKFNIKNIKIVTEEKTSKNAENDKNVKTSEVFKDIKDNKDNKKDNKSDTENDKDNDNINDNNKDSKNNNKDNKNSKDSKDNNKDNQNNNSSKENNSNKDNKENKDKKDNKENKGNKDNQSDKNSKDGKAKDKNKWNSENNVKPGENKENKQKSESKGKKN